MKIARSCHVGRYPRIVRNADHNLLCRSECTLARQDSVSAPFPVYCARRVSYLEHSRLLHSLPVGVNPCRTGHKLSDRLLGRSQLTTCAVQLFAKISSDSIESQGNNGERFSVGDRLRNGCCCLMDGGMDGSW